MRVSGVEEIHFHEAQLCIRADEPVLASKRAAQEFKIMRRRAVEWRAVFTHTVVKYPGPDARSHRAMHTGVLQTF